MYITLHYTLYIYSVYNATLYTLHTIHLQCIQHCNILRYYSVQIGHTSGIVNGDDSTGAFLVSEGIFVANFIGKKSFFYLSLYSFVANFIGKKYSFYLSLLRFVANFILFYLRYEINQFHVINLSFSNFDPASGWCLIELLNNN